MIQRVDPMIEPDLEESDTPCEIINGQIVEKLISTYENVVAGELFSVLNGYVGVRQLGRAVIEVLFEMPGSPNNRRPDVAFVSFQRWPKNRCPPRLNAWPVVPELAVEVVSPNNDTKDMLAKIDEYFQAGVELVWVVLPVLERVYVYSSPTAVRILSRGDDLTGDPVVPGFRLPLNDLFPPPDEPTP